MSESSESVENSVPQTSEEADALFNSIMEPDVETQEPTDGDNETDGNEQSQSVENEQIENSDELFTLKHKDFENGERQFTRDKYTEYAQKGFDYELKMHNLKNERAAFEEKVQDFENRQKSFSEKYDYWENIDKYMVENPAFAETVRQAWDNRLGQQSQATNSPEYQAMQEHIKSLQDRLDAQDKDRQEISQKQAEESLIKSKSDYKSNHPDFDWETEDEFGETLQDRIEKHAVDNGIRSYKLAANSYLFDQHMKRVEMKAKESGAKEIIERNKKGIGLPKNESSIGKPSDISSMSYQDLAREALIELGIQD